MSVEHGYYADGTCPALEWQPEPDTARLIEWCGCMSASNIGLLSMYADASRMKALRSRLEDEAAPFTLTYRLKPRDPDFHSFTGGIPVNAEQASVLFLSSEASTKEEGAKQASAWRLHAGETVASDQYLPLTDPRVAGIVSAAEARMRPAPIVQIRLGPDDLPDETSKGRHFRIRFPARATLWKYFLFGTWRADAIEVIDPAHKVLFAAPVAQSLPNGRTAVTVRSTTPIALQHRPTQSFQLHSREEEGLVLIDRLPAAAPANMGAAEEDMPVSEIYV